MVCKSCQPGEHQDCPEIIRQCDPVLVLADLRGGAWCDCQHRPRRTGQPPSMNLPE